jgi:hypothetical protein
MRATRLLAAVAAGACITAVSPALASAGTSGPAAFGRTERVLLLLTPQNRAGLLSLGTARGLTLAQRRAGLARVLPSSGEIGSLRAIAGSYGFKVTGQTPLSITLSGPASLVSRYFGSARSVDPTGHFAHALPRTPQALRGMVTAAFGGDETRPAARPLAVPAGGYTGQQLADAYAPTAFAAADSLQRQTIASIQLADWSDGAAMKGTTPGDLTNFATANGRPLAPGQYTSVVVDPKGSPPQPDPGTGSGATGVPGGSQEVALDQETLLSVAPYARQRAYFSGDDPVGLLEDYIRVGYDASQGAPITAVTTSWGACEQSFGSTAFAFDDVFSYILSTGVTIFAASGDGGPYDCSGSGDAAVDFPAASPEVVAVGGTTLPSTAGSTDPSTGTPEPASQTPWAYSSTTGDGSGGGQSVMFGRPAWQLSRYRSIAGSGRLVPDIASDADPATGFESLSSTYNSPPPANPNTACTPSSCSPVWAQVGGTSLAAPTQAALYTDELIARGWQSGLGDIHARLYAAPASDFVAAQPEVTGLGAPNWDALFPAIANDPGPVSAVVSATGHVYSRRGHGGFTYLGGTVISPVSTVDYHGINYYVAAGTNRQVYVRTDALSWHTFTNYSQPCTDPTASIALSGTFFVACTNPYTHAGYVGYAPLVDGHLPLLLRGSTGMFRSIGGYLTSGPSITEYVGNIGQYVDTVTSGGTPQLTLFGVGSSGGIVYQKVVGLNGSAEVVSGHWQPTGFRCLAAPAVAVRGSTLYFSCIGTNHALYFDWHTPSGWQRLLDYGSYLVGGDGMAAAPNGLVTSFILNRDGVLFSRQVYPLGGTWVRIGSVNLRYGVGATEQSG